MTPDWGALFHAVRAFSRSDTVDTVDTLAAPAGEGAHSVNTVNSVTGRKEEKNGGGQAAEPVGWLASIARSIRRALADGAVRVADDDGWLVLLRPDGRRLTAAPGIIAQIIAAGLLPGLPAAVGETGGDDADAERAAIQAEPPLPPMGSPERLACHPPAHLPADAVAEVRR